jgi:hypothetical protein
VWCCLLVTAEGGQQHNIFAFDVAFTLVSAVASNSNHYSSPCTGVGVLVTETAKAFLLSYDCAFFVLLLLLLE